jgi:hypothetical protein
MFIDQDTLKRVNINYAYKGFSKLDTPEIRARAGVIEIAEPAAPEDYSDETYYRTESDDAPYVIYTKKSPEQLEQLLDSKNLEAAKRHLLDTDYLFNVDRHAKLLLDEPQRAADLANSRELAREVVRAYKVKYPEVR